MKKKLIIFSSIAVALATVLSVLLLNRNVSEAYRNIELFDSDGNITVERDGSVIDAYRNMKLINGDRVSTGHTGFMRLCVDSDKYLYVGEDSTIKLVATGNEKASKTMLYVERGEMITEIQKKLNSNSSLEIVTPNTTMAIRGTITHTKVDFDTDGNCVTTSSVIEGQVEYISYIIVNNELVGYTTPLSAGETLEFLTTPEQTPGTSGIISRAPFAVTKLFDNINDLMNSITKDGFEVDSLEECPASDLVGIILDKVGEGELSSRFLESTETLVPEDEDPVIVADNPEPVQPVPVITDVPVVTEEPLTTPEPVITEAPDEPDDSAVPTDSEDKFEEPEPTVEVTPEATPEPTPEPTPEVTPEPTPEVTPEPTVEATPEPTAEATPEVTPEPTVEATPEVTPEPTVEATPEVTPELTDEPTPEITPEPTHEVIPVITPEPTHEITPEPTPEITVEPTEEPTPEPTIEPTPEVTPEPPVNPVTPFVPVPEGSYTIEFVLNGGELEGYESSTGTYTYNFGNAVHLPKPTREGFEFEGWYDNPGFDGRSYNVVPASNREDRVFYAKWKEFNSNASYDGSEVGIDDNMLMRGVMAYKTVMSVTTGTAISGGAIEGEFSGSVSMTAYMLGPIAIFGLPETTGDLVGKMTAYHIGNNVQFAVIDPAFDPNLYKVKVYVEYYFYDSRRYTDYIYESDGGT